eukprot:scaffold4196_cov245-Pinguiococcus_pyrenoidosus.AAC.3
MDRTRGSTSSRDTGRIIGREFVKVPAPKLATRNSQPRRRLKLNAASRRESVGHALGDENNPKISEIVDGSVSDANAFRADLRALPCATDGRTL